MRIPFYTVQTRLALVAGALFFFHSPASAHEPGMSTAVITVDGSKAAVVLTFSKDEVEAMTESRKSAAEDWTGALAKKAMTFGGLSPAMARSEFSGDGDVVFTLTFNDLPQGVLQIESPLLGSLVPGHRQYLIVRDSRKLLLLRCFLTPTDSKVTVEIGSGQSG
jgi:hypothetical protein